MTNLKLVDIMAKAEFRDGSVMPGIRDILEKNGVIKKGDGTKLELQLGFTDNGPAQVLLIKDADGEELHTIN